MSKPMIVPPNLRTWRTERPQPRASGTEVVVGRDLSNYHKAVDELTAEQIVAAHQFADALIQSQWAAVERLATVLLMARHLSGSGVAEVVHDNPEGKRLAS